MSGLSVDYSLLVMKFPFNRNLSTHLASFMLQWHVGTPYCFVATLFQCDVCVALHVAGPQFVSVWHRIYIKRCIVDSKSAQIQYDNGLPLALSHTVLGVLVLNICRSYVLSILSI